MGKLLNSYWYEHRPAGFCQIRSVKRYAHPIFNDILSILLEGDSLGIPRASCTCPIHKLWGARTQNIVPHNNGRVRQHVEI